MMKSKVIISEVSTLELKNGIMELQAIMVSGDYTLLYRKNDNSYIVAHKLQSNFENMNCSWAQGYYIKHFTEALELFLNKIGFELKPIN